MKRLTLRARLVAATTLASLVAVALLVLGVQVLLGHMTESESLGVLQDRAGAAETTIRGSREHVRVLEVPSNGLDQNLWIYDLHGRRVDGSAPSPLLAPAVRALSQVTHKQTRVVAGRYRLLGQPARARGDGPVIARVVAGVDLGPYEDSERHALWLSVLLGALIVVAASVASWVAASYSLRQVRRMAQRADDWREHDLSGRFAEGPPRDELTELAQTLDRMLDRIAEALLAERRLTDEVAHELRTPLAVIRSEAQLALLEQGVPEDLREPLLAITEATDRMNHSISAVLTVARAAHEGDHGCTVSEVLEEIGRRKSTRGDVNVTVLPCDESLTVAAPLTVVAATLSPIMDNAFRHARTSVTVHVRHQAPRVLVVVDNDGPGVSEQEAELVFTPGHTSTDDGAGLGLALARRLAHSFGGTVSAEALQHGRFMVELPGA